MNPVLNPDKLIVYTAIYGHTDELAEPEVRIDNVRLVCFTDNRKLTSKNWEIVVTSRTTQDPNREAKKYKIKPYLFFPEYDASLWVDGSVVIKKNPFPVVEEVLRNSNCAVLIHPKYPTVYQEGVRCMDKKLDSREVIMYQMSKYRREGLPEETPVYQLGIWARRHTTTEIITLSESLWSEIMSGSKRDQIAFPYSIWKYNIPTSIICPEVSHGTFKIRNHIRRNDGSRTDGIVYLSEGA